MIINNGKLLLSMLCIGIFTFSGVDAFPTQVYETARRQPEQSIVLPNSEISGYTIDDGRLRSRGALINYGPGNAVVLVAWTGAIYTGVSTMCNPAAFIWAPHVCVASVVGGLFTVGLAGFLLEGKRGANNIVWHHPPLGMGHPYETWSANWETLLPSTIEGLLHVADVHSDFGMMEVHYRKRGVSSHMLHAVHKHYPDNRRSDDITQNDVHMSYMWRDEQEIAYNDLDKNEAELNQAANDFGYKWEYDHPENDKACVAFGANLFERVNNGLIVGGELAVHPQPGQLQAYEDECDQHLNNPSEDMGLLPIN